MDDKTRNLLEYLEPHGVGKYVNIGPFLNEYFPLYNRNSLDEVREKSSAISGYLTSLKNKNFIKLIPASLTGMINGSGQNGYNWFDAMQLQIALEYDGQAELSLEKAKETDDEVRKSILTTNASIQGLNGITEKSLGSQKKLTQLALAIAGVSALIALGSLGVSVVSLLQKPAEPIIYLLPQKDSIFQSKLNPPESVKPKLQHPGPVQIKDSMRLNPSK